MRLANALIKSGDQKAAVSIMHQACDLSPENPFFAHKLGLLLSSAGEKDHGVEILKRPPRPKTRPRKYRQILQWLLSEPGKSILQNQPCNWPQTKSLFSAGSKTNLRELRRRADAIEIAQAVWNALRTSD